MFETVVNIYRAYPAAGVPHLCQTTFIAGVKGREGLPHYDLVMHQKYVKYYALCLYDQQVQPEIIAVIPYYIKMYENVDTNCYVDCKLFDSYLQILNADCQCSANLKFLQYLFIKSFQLLINNNLYTITGWLLSSICHSA